MLEDRSKITGILKTMMGELTKLDDIVNYTEPDIDICYEEKLSKTLTLGHLTAVGIINRAARKIYGENVLERPSEAFVGSEEYFEYFYYRYDTSLGGDITTETLKTLGADVTDDALDCSGEAADFEFPPKDTIEMPGIPAREDKDLQKRLRQLYEYALSEIEEDDMEERSPELVRMIDNSDALMKWMPEIKVPDVLDYVFRAEQESFQNLFLLKIQDERPPKLLERLKGKEKSFYKKAMLNAYKDISSALKGSYYCYVYAREEFPSFGITLTIEDSELMDDYAQYNCYDYTWLNPSTFGAFFVTKVYDDLEKEKKGETKCKK